MAVYVDRLCDYGWRLGASCHLLADTADELHEFARRIGMRPAWAQTRRRGVTHYDLTAKRRLIVLRLGAIEVDRSAAGVAATTDGHGHGTAGRTRHADRI